MMNKADQAQDERVAGHLAEAFLGAKEGNEPVGFTGGMCRYLGGRAGGSVRLVAKDGRVPAVNELVLLL